MTLLFMRHRRWQYGSGGIPGPLFRLALDAADGVVPENIMGIFRKQCSKHLPERPADQAPAFTEIKGRVDEQAMVAVFGGGDIEINSQRGGNGLFTIIPLLLQDDRRIATIDFPVDTKHFVGQNIPGRLIHTGKNRPNRRGRKQLAKSWS